jgi:hypothetical protein
LLRRFNFCKFIFRAKIEKTKKNKWFYIQFINGKIEVKELGSKIWALIGDIIKKKNKSMERAEPPIYLWKNAFVL